MMPRINHSTVHRAARGAAMATIFAAAAVLASPASATAIAPTFDSFGTLAGATFGGSGIPNDAVAITTIVDGSNTITLGLTAHQRYENPPLANNGAGIFAATPGANFGDPTGATTPSPTLGATWNFAFYVDIAGGGDLGDYAIELLYDLAPGVGTDESALGIVSLSAIAPGAVLVQDSLNLLFGFLSVDALPFIDAPGGPFDPFASGEYSFALRVVSLAGVPLGESAILVNVPEPATLALLGGGLLALAAIRRRRTC